MTKANGFLRGVLLAGASIALVVFFLLLRHSASVEKYQILGRGAMAQLDTLYADRPRILRELEVLDVRVDSLEVKVDQRLLEKRRP